MKNKVPQFQNHQEALDFIFSRLGKQLRLATPLGLGKPNQLLNGIYQKIKADPQSSLKIYTALSLNAGKPAAGLEEKFLGPFLKKHFGEDYPKLDYVQDTLSGKTPPWIHLHEFYFQAAQNLGKPLAQRDYISLNYTHVARNILACDVNILVQLIASKSENGKTSYSLSCNSDLTLDVVDLYKEAKKPLLIIGVIHPDLPFLGGDAEVPEDFFGGILKTPEIRHQLFAMPKVPLDATDYLIGLHASQLLVDDGTLQIGIGSLSDALVKMTILRHEQNSQYRELLEAYPQGNRPLPETTVFKTGLYGTSEMLMDGFMHLRRHGILKREVLDLDRKNRRYLHGAFFLGSKEFYQWLRTLKGDDYDGLSMTRVSKVNDLYDAHELALRRQRKNARFFNTCMKVTLLGGAASDTLEDGEVVSGVGGQYNFVAMSRELPDSLSALLLRSTHSKNGRRVSNVVWGHGQITIPRHLRDIVITEYGTAFLRGKSDEECITALIEITDSEFQEELIATAKKNGKLRKDYQVPEWARKNTPQKIQTFVKTWQQFFPDFPFGSDFTPVEEKISVALLKVKELRTPSYLLKTFIRGLRQDKKKFSAELSRLGLEKPRGTEKFYFSEDCSRLVSWLECSALYFK